MQTLLDANDREGVVSTFLREVAGITAAELEMLRAAPSWPGRVAAAHTILREIHALEGLPRFDAERFKAVKTPVLLLLGGDSPSLYSDTIAQIHEALPNSKVVVLAGQQHVAMNTAPDLFLREVLAFLAVPA